jgi:hypothetical protein
MRGVYQHFKENNCTASWRNTISATSPHSLGFKVRERAALAVKKRLASVSRIGELAKPDFSAQAARFMRRRKKRD